MKKSGFIVIICFLCLFLSSCGKKSETGIHAGSGHHHNQASVQAPLQIHLPCGL